MRSGEDYSAAQYSDVCSDVGSNSDSESDEKVIFSLSFIAFMIQILSLAHPCTGIFPKITASNIIKFLSQRERAR